MRALIASGSGRYADPWHPFAHTSERLGEVLDGAGFDVEIDAEVDHAMTRLPGVDLLVVNAGDPWTSAPAGADARAVDGLADALARGIGILAVHSAVASLRDYPDWAPAVGAMWVPTLSYHPPASETTITVLSTPDGAAMAPFTVHDERYCRLQRFGRSTTVAEHAGDGAPEPAAWVRTHGAARVAVDVLGHDERSYDSAGHRELLQRLARWAVGGSA